MSTRKLRSRPASDWLAAVLVTTLCCGGAAMGAPPQTFYSQSQPVGAGTGRGYITMADGVPIAMGFELTPEALTNLPPIPADEIVPVYVAPLPPETAGTPFRFVVVAYASAHEPPHSTAHEPAHFHVAFLINPPVQDAAPPFTRETTPAAPAEVPEDTVQVVNLDGVPVAIPGLGGSYDDPTEPLGLPAWTTVGQNFFFYDGHMNGISLGPSIELLQAKANLVGVIKQPDVYPRPGSYPLWHVSRFDAARNVHVLEVVDFVPAARSLPQ